jgi:hypothetical protein
MTSPLYVIIFLSLECLNLELCFNTTLAKPREMAVNLLVLGMRDQAVGELNKIFGFTINQPAFRLGLLLSSAYSLLKTKLLCLHLPQHHLAEEGRGKSKRASTVKFQ